MSEIHHPAPDHVSSPPPDPDARGYKRIWTQFKRFIGVGLLAAIIHYALLIISVEAGWLTPVYGALLGYIGGGIISYILNREITFDSDAPIRRSMQRFVIVALIGFGLTYLMMHVLYTLQQWPYILAQILTTAVVLFWSFIAHKFWTFNDDMSGQM
jgi:putative flippase GtrA